MSESAIIVYADGPDDLQRAIAAWIDAKASRSDSAGTVRVYRKMLADFAAHLALIGLRLDSADVARVADAAQAWARHSQKHSGSVARSTYNHRLAVLSSFYSFGVKRGHLAHNPIDRIERARVQEYAGARPLSPEDVQARLAAIDRSTLIGARDYALLLLALYTGRRASELAALTWCDIQWSEPVTVTWTRTKGGKVERDVLPPHVARALDEWVTMMRPHGGLVTDESPVWRAMSPHGTLTARRLSARSLTLLCERRIGTSRVHTLRHTFAHAMEQAGARVSEIQAALGHANISTTSRYLHAMRSEANPYADRLTRLYGLDA